jgi:hypothetical protein
MIVVGGAYGVRRHQVRLEGDVAYARRRRASRAAQKRLAGARKLLGVETQREFYAEVGSALQGFLGDKLNIAEVSRDVVDAYFACLEHCDRQRFAPSTPDEGVMTKFLGEAESAMSTLDRELSK